MSHSSTEELFGSAEGKEIARFLAAINLDTVTLTEFLKPCSHNQAAELLGMAPGTLKNLRSRGGGPKGWAIHPGIGGRYRSRLDVIVWFREQHRLATTEYSQRDAAA